MIAPQTITGGHGAPTLHMKNRGGIAPAAVLRLIKSDYFFAYFFGYLIVISLSRLSAPSTSFITHSM